MLLQAAPEGTYLIRLPLWGTALIALGICGLMFNALGTALRRRWGAAGLAAYAAAGCALFLAAAWDQPRPLTSSSELGMWLSIMFAAFITFIVPAVVIHRIDRREPRPHFVRTIVYAVASSYVAILVGGLGIVLVALVVQLLRAPVA